MKSSIDSARRQFLWKAGAALAAPVAMATAGASGNSVDDSAALQARLAILEDLQAIRELQRDYARRLNAGEFEELAHLCADPAQVRLEGVDTLALDPLADDTIEIAADRNAATARVHCAVETAIPIEPSCPLVEMARAQGGGVTKQCERGVLESSYSRKRGIWKIERLAFRKP